MEEGGPTCFEQQVVYGEECFDKFFAAVALYDTLMNNVTLDDDVFGGPHVVSPPGRCACSLAVVRFCTLHIDASLDSCRAAAGRFPANRARARRVDGAVTGVYRRDEGKRGITVAAPCTLRGTTHTHTCAQQLPRNAARRNTDATAELNSKHLLKKEICPKFIEVKDCVVGALRRCARAYPVDFVNSAADIALRGTPCKYLVSGALFDDKPLFLP
ncbi:hypothetical protein EVAR_93001_1 [Eumeta japonica]|uniref:Uncharacterized protein n=1 Tax=Eumeta variegata TaxID=151549 RepID=A0A4C1TD63_EUMVA|nr:hypothetical protein EVAR_93001_1 [Eumeta japonica]